MCVWTIGRSEFLSLEEETRLLLRTPLFRGAMLCIQRCSNHTT